MNFLIEVLLLASCLLGASGLKCWVCEDLWGSGESCASLDLKGNLTDCNQEESQGCFLSQVETGTSETEYIRGCTGVTEETAYKCQDVHSGNMHLRSCLCKGNGCNADFDTAAGPALQCYQCSSSNASLCGPDVTGDPTNCPYEKRKGCSISKTTSTSTGVIFFDRACTEQSDPANYKCDTSTGHGIDMKYCNCHGTNCNQNFDTAAPTFTGKASTLLLSLPLLLLPILSL